MRRVIVLGSTGSIGVQALEVIAANPDRFTIVGLGAAGDRQLVSAQAEAFGVEHVAIGPSEAQQLVSSVNADVVFNGIAGMNGLAVSVTILKSGATLALANKESLVVGGELLMSLARDDQVVPVDAELSALGQALLVGAEREVRRLVLTASGGPFRGRDRESLRTVTPQQTLPHAGSMLGATITTNSATMVNKGFEVIAAHVLFGVDCPSIEVTVHPQSIVHSMVEFVDGSTIAQCAPPNMRVPIAIALDWPNRVAGVGVPLDWATASKWTFEPLDDDVFPAVTLAREVGQAGGDYPAVFAAANERAVTAFHAGRIGFLDIVTTVRRVVEGHREASGGQTLESVLSATDWARSAADELFPS